MFLIQHKFIAGIGSAIVTIVIITHVHIITARAAIATVLTVFVVATIGIRITTDHIVAEQSVRIAIDSRWRRIDRIRFRCAYH